MGALLDAVQRGPGTTEAFINSRKLSRSGPGVERLRRAVHSTTQHRFGGLAQAQMQARLAGAGGARDLGLHARAPPPAGWAAPAASP